MRKACELFATSERALKPGLADLLDAPVRSDLAQFAGIFIELQEARFKADYDLLRQETLTEAEALLRKTMHCFAQWDAMGARSDGQVFVLSLLLHPSWSRRG